MAIIQNLEAFVQSYPAGLDSVTDLQLSQNENGRQIRFTIGGVTIPAGSVATISGTKPDGVVYSNTGTIEGDDTVIFDEDVQMTAVFGTWYAKIRITNAGNTIASARVRFIIDKDPVDSGAIPSESQLDGLVAEAEEYAEAAEDAAERSAITYGSPLTASTAAAMTDVNRVYVYTGSESGYTYGNWYYYNGSAWTSGGIYNSAAVETDTTLTESGVPADAKKTGDEISALKDDLIETSTYQKLLADNIPDTVQTYTFTDGAVSQVTHSNNGSVVRTDVFAYTSSSITETRTLNTGESLTILTNLTTLETTVTYYGGQVLQKVYSMTDAVLGIWIYQSNGTYYLNERSDRAGSKLPSYSPQIGDIIRVEDSQRRYKFTTGTGENNYRLTSVDDLVVTQEALTTLKSIFFVKVDGSNFTSADISFLNQNTHVYRPVS